MQSFTSSLALLLALTSLSGCSKKEEPKFAARERTPSAISAPEPTAINDGSAAGESAAPSDGGGSISGAFWETIKVVNGSPLCVFSSYEERAKVNFPHDAKRQKLEANKSVLFAVYAPDCMNELCYMPPSIQCWVEEPEAGVIKVESRFWADHKRGSSCSGDCQPTVGDCITSELKPGKYTVKYGDQTYTLRIPSVLQSPCLKQ